MNGVDQSGSFEDAAVPDGTWTVAQLNREIEQVLSDAEPRFPAYIIGEIAEIDVYDFGAFFDLRDLEDDHVIACLAWSSALDEFEYDLKEGAKAVVEATVDFYPERGDCQLLVSGYWPLGESKRHQELATLRRQLAGEGLFDEDRKQPLPPHPACLGLVTSPSGSAREDAWAAISERSPRTTVKLCGATVQGENAVPSLITAVNHLDADPEVEAIIVTRGGGAEVELWCFNAEPLVRCIATCSTPVIAAIGHEDDNTLVENAADARAMTPTEAGVIATTPVTDLKQEAATLERRINTTYDRLVADRLEHIDRRLTTAHDTLKQQVTQHESLQQRAKNLERRVTTAYQTLVDTRLDSLETRIDSGVKEIELAAEADAAASRVARGRLTDLEHRITAAYQAHTTRELNRIEHRIETAYRDLEADERVKAGTKEARRLRIVVAVLLGIILLGALAIGIWLL